MRRRFVVSYMYDDVHMFTYICAYMFTHVRMWRIREEIHMITDEERKILADENAAKNHTLIADSEYAEWQKAKAAKIKTQQADLRRRISDQLIIAKALAADITVTEDEVDEAVAQFIAVRDVKKARRV